MPISDTLRAVSPLLLAAMLAACGGAEPDGSGNVAADVAAGSEASNEPAANRIECAVAGEAFARACTIEEARDADGTLLTLRHPDGGFRRLRVTRDGRGVVAADGAEAARVAVSGSNQIEVSIADARYRLPATIGPTAR